MNNETDLKKIVGISVIILSIFSFVSWGIYSDKKEEAFKEAELKAINGIQTIVFTDGVYAGNVVDKRLDGIGKYILDTGDYFDGEWLANRPNGEGKLRIDGVGVHEGFFSDGKRNGEGTFRSTDGVIVEGTWENDKLVGNFKITYTDSVFFEGNASEDGKGFDGLLTIINESGTCEYPIKNSEASEPTFYYNNGTKIHGPIVNGKFNGECRIDYYNGDYYVGTVVNNMRDGHGKYTFEFPENSAELSTYEGTWKDDWFVSGTYTYNHVLGYNERIVGSFVNNKPDGECVYYKDGIKYITTWKDGKCVKVEKVGE